MINTVSKVVVSGAMLTMFAFSPLDALAADKISVDLTIDGESVSVETEAKTVRNLLAEIDFKYKVSDDINYKMKDNIANEMEVVINTEKEVTFSNKGELETVKTNALTVEELLEDLKVDIKKTDVIIPSLDSKISDEDEVAIIRLNEEKYTKEINIDYEVIEKMSFEIPYGEKVVEQEGQLGKRVETFNKVVRNEITLSDDKVSNEIIESPVNQIISVGTREVINKEIPNETVTQEDPNMFVGESRVINVGSQGTLVEIYENNGVERNLVSKEITHKPVDKVIAKGTKAKPVPVSKISTSVESKYTLAQFQFHGVVYSNGKKFTYYSQKVLPGGGLKIPGRHVNSGGYVADKDGFIVVASNRSIRKGTVIDTPFGYKGKVYDVCASCSPEWFDIYTK